MGERLAGGNDAIALLGNTIATGAGLVVLILVFGAISGAHFNPAVTLAFSVRREIGARDAVLYVVVQIAGGIAGVMAAHFMFGEPLLVEGVKARTGAGQWLGRVRGRVRAPRKHPRVPANPSRGGPVRGGTLHHRRLLVHLVDLVREPRGNHRPLVHPTPSPASPPATPRPSSRPRSRAPSPRPRYSPGWLWSERRSGVSESATPARDTAD